MVIYDRFVMRFRVEKQALLSNITDGHSPYSILFLPYLYLLDEEKL